MSLPPTARAARSHLRLIAAACSLVVLAGCGATVQGVAQGGATAPVTSGSTSGSSTTGPSTTRSAPTPPSTDSTSGIDTSSTDTSSTDTSSTDTSSTDTSSTDSSSTDTSSTSTGGSEDAKLYPTAPINYNKTPNTEGIAALLEGRRLAGYVLDPSQVESGLTRFVPIPTFPLRDSSALSAIFPDESTALIARRQGMYTGYSATRSDPESKSSMVVAAFVFPDATSAKAAATAMANSSKGEGDTDVTLSSPAGAVGNQGAAGTTEYSGQVFVATGSVVAYVWVSGGVSQKAGVPKRLQTALTREVALLKGYTPIAKKNLMSQEFDPTGLFSRTLPPKDNYTFYGMYSRQGSLHYLTDPPKTRQLFGEAGVDVVSLGRSVLYRAKDATGAGKVRDSFYADEVADNPRYRDFDPGTTAGSPRCLQDSVQSQYVCYATVDRIAIEYSTQSEDDLRKSLEAQVALLQQQ